MTENADHPAKFSNAILDAIANEVRGCKMILDPFAGVGKVALLKERGVEAEVWCNELEEEWAKQALGYGADHIIVGDALVLGEKYTGQFDCIVTSPCYGNRMADHHNAQDGSKRMTYTHTLGRELTRGNSGVLQWGPKYKVFHIKAWREIMRCLRDGGIFVLNCSNHIRKGEEQMVTQWHVMILQTMGLVVRDWLKVETPRMRKGENHELRVTHESVVVFQKTTPEIE